MLKKLLICEIIVLVLILSACTSPKPIPSDTSNEIKIYPPYDSEIVKWVNNICKCEKIMLEWDQINKFIEYCQKTGVMYHRSKYTTTGFKF